MQNRLRVVLPKGRIFERVSRLMNEAGYGVSVSGRMLRPRVADPTVEVKIMKPKNIPQLIAIGSHDAGFAGYDWCLENGVDVAEILDLEYNPVRIVAAVPESVDMDELTSRRIIVASEYEQISRSWLDEQGFDYVFLRVHGATEVFPPDDADMIIDNTATGSTLQANNLRIVSEITSSSTRFIASRKAMEEPWKREKITEMRMLFNAVMAADRKVMLEMNIPAASADDIIHQLPCMKSPTVAKLHADNGYSAKIVVNRSAVSALIPDLIRMGATDILEYDINKVIV